MFKEPLCVVCNPRYAARALAAQLMNDHGAKYKLHLPDQLRTRRTRTLPPFHSLPCRVDPGVIQAWNDCMKLSGGGMKSTIKSGVDSSSFSADFTFQQSKAEL